MIMKKDERLLLKEDMELLKKLNDIEISDTPMAIEHQRKEMMKIQVEATLRSRKTMVELDDTNGRFSFVVGVLALMQLAIAMFQFVFDVGTSDKKSFALFVGFACLVMLYLIFWATNKRLK